MTETGNFVALVAPVLTNPVTMICSACFAGTPVDACCGVACGALGPAAD